MLSILFPTFANSNFYQTMKQMKFLMAALTVLMGLTFTSCIGDGDSTAGDVNFLKVVSTYPYVFQYANDGLRVTATNSSELMADAVGQNLSYGDIVYLQYTYDSDQQKVTADTKNIEARVTIGYNCSRNIYSTWMENKGEGEENATILDLGSVSEYGMYWYDRNTLLLGISFLAKESLNDHFFTLVYDTTQEEEPGEDVLKLYLRHQNSEDSPSISTGCFKAFDLTDILMQYGKTPDKVRIYANESNKSTSCSLDDAKSELQYEEIDYKKYFEE